MGPSGFLALSFIVIGGGQALSQDTLVVVEGEPVKLHCATDERPRQVKWMRNNITIAQFTRQVESTEWWSPSLYLFDRRSFSLIIQSARPVDEGVFECRALYYELPPSSGRRMAVRVISKPRRPSAPIVTSFTSRSVGLSWEEQIGVNHSVVVNVGSTPDANHNHMVPVEGTHALVTGLTPFTVYTMQLMATNAAGQSERGTSSIPVRTKGEPPVSPPSIASATNSSNSSVLLRWTPPPPESVHGVIVGYRVIVHRLVDGRRTEHYHADGTNNSYEVTNLTVYTKYSMAISADNNYGYSPSSSVIVLTAEGVPTSPPLITDMEVHSSSSLSLRWTAPTNTNGHIIYYNVYYRSNGEPLNVHDLWRRGRRSDRTAVVHVEEGIDQPIVEHMFTALRCYHEYTMWVTAWTLVGEGPPSSIVRVFTDTCAPSPPSIIAISPLNQHAVGLQWTVPRVFHRQIDEYAVHMTDGEGRKEVVNTSNTFIQLSISPSIEYTVQVMAITRSVVSLDTVYTSTISLSATFLLHNSVMLTTLCDEGGTASRGNHVFLQVPTTDISLQCHPHLHKVHQPSYNHMKRAVLVVASVMGAACMGCVLCSAILLWLLGRRREEGEFKLINQTDSDISLPLKPYDDLASPNIAVASFEEHCRTVFFDEEFVRLSVEGEEEEKENCCHTARMAHNMHKNRYANILPFDASRVVLRGEGEGDYINANYIDGYDRRRAYICTQAPLPGTTADFWHMVWQEGSNLVVMLSNGVGEQRSTKYHVYWPPSVDSPLQTDDGAFEVRLLSESVRAFYTTRVLLLTRRNGITPIERVIDHYHFTDWPDHSIPCTILPLLSFVRRTARVSTGGRGGGGGRPTVVHCSAGVGRSGCYIVIHAMLQQIIDVGHVNIFSFLAHVRRQRMYLVQTAGQYELCHAVLLEAMQSGVTEVGAAHLPVYVKDMLPTVDIVSDKSLLQMQYERVIRGGGLPLGDPIVVEHCEGEEGVQCSYTIGYAHEREYIVVRGGGRHSVWHIAAQFGCRSVVLLHRSLWPSDEEDEQCSRLSVRRRGGTVDEGEEVEIYRDDGQQLIVTVFTCDNLAANNGVSSGGTSVPILLVDDAIGQRAFQFVLLSNLSRQLREEGCVDVYSTTALCHASMPWVPLDMTGYASIYDSVCRMGGEESPLCSTYNIHTMLTDDDDRPSNPP